MSTENTNPKKKKRIPFADPEETITPSMKILTLRLPTQTPASLDCPHELGTIPIDPEVEATQPSGFQLTARRVPSLGT